MWELGGPGGDWSPGTIGLTLGYVDGPGTIGLTVGNVGGPGTMGITVG